MSDWLLYLIIAGGLAFAVSSWWGVRRLKARHIRSAVREDTHSPGLGPEGGGDPQPDQGQVRGSHRR